LFTRLRREIEPRWVAEYVAATWPKAQVIYRCPLGSIPEDVERAYGVAKGARIYRPWRPEVDACVLLPGALFLIEGKIFKVMDGLSKLPVYRSLVPLTPELRPYADLPVRMKLLVVKPLPWVRQAAQQMGVELVEYAPNWVVQIWEERDKYWTPEAVSARELRKKRMVAAGLA